ncbi:MAG TPA: hypothetical protein VN668_09735 [Stellaceae bacterium]|nr:hypothetical protein [Stellaceae bacterium]
MKPEKPKAAVKNQKARNGCLGLIGLIVLLTVIGSLAGNNDNSSSSKNDNGTPTKSDAAVPAQPSCKTDWTQCADNADLVNNYDGWTHVQFECKDAANDHAKYGTPKWPWFAFSTFLKGTNYVTSGIAVAIEKDAQFQNGFGAMVHSEVVCSYDLRAKHVQDVSITAR